MQSQKVSITIFNLTLPELFEQSLHKRRIQIYDCELPIFEEWLKYCLKGISHVAGVDVKATTWERKSAGGGELFRLQKDKPNEFDESVKSAKSLFLAKFKRMEKNGSLEDLEDHDVIDNVERK